MLTAHTLTYQHSTLQLHSVHPKRNLSKHYTKACTALTQHSPVLSLEDWQGSTEGASTLTELRLKTAAFALNSKTLRNSFSPSCLEMFHVCGPRYIFNDTRKRFISYVCVSGTERVHWKWVDSQGEQITGPPGEGSHSKLHAQQL